jgi:hypothetical protein
LKTRFGSVAHLREKCVSHPRQSDHLPRQPEWSDFFVELHAKRQGGARIGGHCTKEGWMSPSSSTHQFRG